ncbi:MAG: nuclear transport factor 2 family protein [Bacteroidota bacterium]
MKSILSLALVLLALNVSGQETFTEDDAKAIVDTFFEGFHKGDTLMMRSVMTENVQLQTAFRTKDGSNKLNTDSIDKLLNAIANRTADQKWDERLLDYKVQIDGNLAQVWTPYEFWFNDNFSHCGANAFTLVNTDDGWKIIHLIDSRRKSTCGK